MRAKWDSSDESPCEILSLSKVRASARVLLADSFEPGIHQLDRDRDR